MKKLILLMIKNAQDNPVEFFIGIMMGMVTALLIRAIYNLII